MGYSSLRSWLRPVTRHYALDHYRLEQIRRVAEQRAALLHPTQTASPDPVEWDETLDWCRAEVVRALNTLEHRDRLLLLLRYRSGWPGHAIATALRVHPGHFSRLLGQATERLRLHLERPWEKLFQEYDTATVAYLLFRGLDEAHAEEPELDAHRPPGAEESAMSTTEKRKKPADPKKSAGTRGKRSVHKTLPVPKKAAAVKGAPKAAPKKAVPTSAPPAKEAQAPIVVPPKAEHPLPDVGPEELELFLPERVATAKMGDSPEDLFAKSEGQSPEERAAVVCLDAREEQDLDAVLAWLKKFDAVAAEQYEDDTEAPCEPHRVVFLSEAAPEVPDEWSTRADLDWVRTEDKTGDILPLYRRYLQDDLRDFVSGDLEDFFPKPPVGEAERLVDRIPTAKQEAWKARVQMFQERDDEA